MYRLFLFVTGCFLVGSALAADPPELRWEVGYSLPGDTNHTRWTKATVPGAVQLDIAGAEKYGLYYYAEN